MSKSTQICKCCSFWFFNIHVTTCCLQESTPTRTDEDLLGLARALTSVAKLLEVLPSTLPQVHLSYVFSKPVYSHGTCDPFLSSCHLLIGCTSTCCANALHHKGVLQLGSWQPPRGCFATGVRAATMRVFCYWG